MAPTGPLVGVRITGPRPRTLMAAQMKSTKDLLRLGIDGRRGTPDASWRRRLETKLSSSVDDKKTATGCIF
ncbi:hypothetical protein ZWY2020_012223 [Hordeum vulgare]|nr:hypothetical protein ZWY2020_012223 [Hordeum vulgare]